MKPLYIVGTARDVGKTTTALGLLFALRARGLNVAYVKPIGQRVGKAEGRMLHDDARLVAGFFGDQAVQQVDMAVPLPSGRVECEVKDFHPEKLIARLVEAYATLASKHDLVIVEGMGHVAMGSCLGMSAAEVCRSIDAMALLISGGGIGRAIDDISLCSTFLTARGASMGGVVVNKVWPEKYDRVKEATTQGLANLGIRSFGTVPYQEQLSAPTMYQIHKHVGGEIIGGADHMGHRVRHTIIAAMETSHMIKYIEGATLVITPGDRSDNILACLRAHMFGGQQEPAVSGLILTGGFMPPEEVMSKVRDFHLPVIAVQSDTFSTASKIVHTVFKILPDDQERIKCAIELMGKYVDVDGILKAVES